MTINIALIRESFEKVKPIANEAISQFYEFLWQDYPESKQLFAGVNIEKQKVSLINSLVYAVDHLDQQETLTRYLHKLGSRHVHYGTKHEHYGWVGYSLIKTFAKTFDKDWTAELEEQWIQAYNLIAKTMQEGASEAFKESEKKTVLDFPKGNSSATEINLTDELKNRIREKVRRTIQEFIRQEVAIAVQEEICQLESTDPIKLLSHRK